MKIQFYFSLSHSYLIANKLISPGRVWFACDSNWCVISPCPYHNTQGFCHIFFLPVHLKKVIDKAGWWESSGQPELIYYSKPGHVWVNMLSVPWFSAESAIASFILYHLSFILYRHYLQEAQRTLLFQKFMLSQVEDQSNSLDKC